MRALSITSAGNAVDHADRGTKSDWSRKFVRRTRHDKHTLSPPRMFIFCRAREHLITRLQSPCGTHIYLAYVYRGRGVNQFPRATRSAVYFMHPAQDEPVINLPTFAHLAQFLVRYDTQAASKVQRVCCFHRRIPQRPRHNRHFLDEDATERRIILFTLRDIITCNSQAS